MGKLRRKLGEKFVDFIEKLSYLEFFGRPTSLFYKHRNMYFTKLGLCFSLLIIIFGFVCLFFFGRPVFLKENPKITRSDYFKVNPEPMIIDPETSPYMISINNQDGSEYFTDLRLAKPTVSQISMIKNISGQFYSRDYYDLEVCTKEHFTRLAGENKDYFLKFNLSNFFCLPKSLKNLTVRGTFALIQK